jgi:hypothetical protein
MKITRKQLRRIIKEEASRLNELFSYPPPSHANERGDTPYEIASRHGGAVAHVETGGKVTIWNNGSMSHDGTFHLASDYVPYTPRFANVIRNIIDDAGGDRRRAYVDQGVLDSGIVDKVNLDAIFYDV